MTQSNFLDPNMDWYGRMGSHPGTPPGQDPVTLASSWGTPEQNQAALAGWASMLAGGVFGIPHAGLIGKGLTSILGVPHSTMSPIAQGGKLAMGFLGDLFGGNSPVQTFSQSDYSNALDAEDAALGQAFSSAGLGAGIGNEIGGDAGGMSGIGADGNFGSDAALGIYADGGPVNGPGTGTSDSINARLSDGEYVMPADVVQKLGVGFFDNIKSKYHTPTDRRMPGYADGGEVLGGRRIYSGRNSYPMMTFEQDDASRERYNSHSTKENLKRLEEDYARKKRVLENLDRPAGGGRGHVNPPGYADGGLFGTGIGLSDIINTGIGFVNAGRQGDASRDMQNWMNNNFNQMNQLYNPGSPEYNQLWDQMSRSDAAAGRNSQYGPRSSDFLAKIATNKADNIRGFTTGMATPMANALNQNANKYTGVASALGRALGGSQTNNLSSILNWLRPMSSGGFSAADDIGNYAEVPGVGGVDFGDLFGAAGDTGSALYDGMIDEQLFDDSFWEDLF